MMSSHNGLCRPGFRGKSVIERCLHLQFVWRCLNPVFLTLLFASHGNACNIPVFRYALERWQTDLVEVLVFHDAPLLSAEVQEITELQTQSRNHGGAANLEVIVRNVTQLDDEDLETVWKEISLESKPALPQVVVRYSGGRGRRIKLWQGSVIQLKGIQLLDSPVRRELTKRLLEGDSVVWLVLQSTDQAKSKAVVELLETTLPEVAKQISLPKGIGLPGSELFSAIPLDIHFSVLTLDPQDSRERVLVTWLNQHASNPLAEGKPIVVPVFGRGRVLEVLTTDVVSPELVRELSLFLSSACSCQMKELNPGFDLLLNINWESKLFGDEIPDIPEPLQARIGQPEAPILVTIPPGNALDSPSGQQGVLSQTATVRPRESTIESLPSPTRMLGHRLDWLLLMFLSVVIVTVSLAGFRR